MVRAFAAALLVLVPVAGCALVDDGSACEVDGEAYAVGESFVAPNGPCNTCTCQADGSTLCTRLDCGLPGCEVDGVRHDVGESFPSTDGCNTCSCGEGGRVACTLRACVEPTCGGLLGARCDEGFFCDFAPDARCGAADQTGVCRVVPEVCDDVYQPVCGCDGRTYGNSCEANGAGVSVASRGACASECNDAVDCPQPDCACLDEDGDGSCDNTCPVAQCIDGRCEIVVSEPSLGVGDPCGGFRLPGSPDCGQGLFCQHQPGALCGAADAPGECVAIPFACAEIFEPVCGCDGNTYSSACHAALAQVGIVDVGECN